MTYNFLTVGTITPEAIAAALAKHLGVAVSEVDVADADGDPDERNWDALVSCEYSAVRGDVAWSLDIYAQDAVAHQPTERTLASAFASATQRAVLFPAEGTRPSAYWLATPEGVVTRARLLASDDEEPVYTVDAIEAPVPQLPNAKLTRIPEAVRELQIATPTTDAFTASLASLRQLPSGSQDPALSEEPGSPAWYACTRLGSWEMLIRQMAARWAPSDWYPQDLYRDRLISRDGLAELRNRLPKNVADLFQESLEQLDLLFVELTIEDPQHLLARELAAPGEDPEAHGSWWYRRPEPLPWS
ncbi:hypothetical protein [Streptomyces sp. NBC_01262]|uniref:hypothetical protein n=1 Tax=Streptomyces sp. NBC_01262 TaxID=2903803 RepID=UPI002E3494E4|nr:hypothetical protein [Streptomyces sp. NBC_01262]